MEIRKVGSQAAGSARLREETRYSRLRGRAEHSHSGRERAGRGAARRGREGSESWPELLLTRCLEAWQGQAGRSRLPFSVLLGGKHARCRHPLAAHQDTYDAPQSSRAHYPLSRGVKVRDQQGGFLSVSGVWRPGMGPFAASGPLRLAVSQSRVPPPLSVGAHRGHSNSFGPTRKVQSKREVWMLPRMRDLRKSKVDLS